MIPKFKAKSIAKENNGEWIYGTPIEGDDGTFYILGGVFEATDEYITIDKWCAVAKETICMSTDFLANGNEVFEGDILRDGYGHRVVWYNEIWGAWIAGTDEYAKDLKDCWRAEIVGNKFDNPELLEVEEDE
ncbi:hypothetical protein DDV21_010295 [Streptococcus chenjunshii]|uniref:YopX protein domain-containing protein n=1 Tax=Streptococcus chenjunshii TaxID=2173853 RepID=A0A372KLQ9_9STRE|nr:YopX family protein [Streptococcus chenjunshii]AXQ79437.1 hypothetical protein DDV21_010295 [Streptococcus chenjunshii]RFU51105.1 hypothetical protein DDV22_05205 [Streptococcus chenjunshii]RFU53203.1 hypothetical protein DDV23_05715 [Streptococcus chenjunshii]